MTSGCISANHLVLDTLVRPGDHVIVQHPTYGQLYEVPRRAGAQVEFWKWKWTQKEHGIFAWEMDFDELESLIRDTTKLIVLSNPNNPTGSILSKTDLQRVVGLAAKRGVYILCDEVFRFLHHDTEVEAPHSLLELGYEKTIITGSLSKGFALPGIRVGWVAMHTSLRESVLAKVKSSRDYTTIAVSQVDQQIAAFALEPHVRSKILARSREICQRNLRMLSNWISENDSWVQWAPSSGGGTTVLKILDSQGEVVDDLAFAKALAREERVCVPPAGHCFGFEADGKGGTELKGFVRVGIVMGEGDLEKGLSGLEKLRERWSGVSV